MSLFFRYALVNEFKFQYPSWKFFIAQLISSFLTVWTYYLTSQALSTSLDPGLNWYGQDYFHYLMIGELMLTLPQAFLDCMSRGIRWTLVKEMLPTLIFNRKKPFKNVSLLSLSLIARDLTQLGITLLMAIVFFDFRLDIGSSLQAMALILISLPTFLYLGFVFSTPVIITGKGQGILGQFNFLVAILSGVYFPLEVFPEWFSGAIRSYFPPTYLLENIRSLFAPGGATFSWPEVVVLFVTFGVVSYFLARASWAFSLRQVKRKGLPQVSLH